MTELASSHVDATAGPPLDIVIRFNDLPDVPLSIPGPATTSILSLKRTIRRTVSSVSDTRLTLIYAGKLLQDPAAVQSISQPGRNKSIGQNDNRESGAKGKLPQHKAQLYIHCATGESLNPEVLASEPALAESYDDVLSAAKLQATTPQHDPAASTAPSPRGFDRLHEAGFSQDDIRNLRLQFRSTLGRNRQAEDMPSTTEQVVLEDHWLDNNYSAETGAVVGPSGAGEGSEDESGLRDWVVGNFMGFFWPLGAMGWVGREPENGVWTQRQGLAVLCGVFVNLCFGVVRMLG